MPGTLDLLVLHAASLGEEHGYGFIRRIDAMTGGDVIVEEGALYPSLDRLEARGWLRSEFGRSRNNRRARFFCITPQGRGALARKARDWLRTVDVMARALSVSKTPVEASS